MYILTTILSGIILQVLGHRDLRAVKYVLFSDFGVYLLLGPALSHHFKLTLSLDECKALYGHWTPNSQTRTGSIFVSTAKKRTVGGALKKKQIYIYI